MVRPEHTSRPLYWIAQEHGADYTDVLNVAWSLKRKAVARLERQVTGIAGPTAFATPAERLSNSRMSKACFDAIYDFEQAFVDEQDTIARSQRNDDKRNAP